MENKLTVTQFATGTLTGFSFVMLFLMLVGPLVGDKAQGVSALFALGTQGIPYRVVLQALLLSIYSTSVCFFFLSQLVFKKMLLLWRVVWMFACILIGDGMLSVWFGWFPADDPKAWVAYLLSFTASAALTAAAMVLKTRHENAKVKRKLEEYKQKKREETSS